MRLPSPLLAVLAGVAACALAASPADADVGFRLVDMPQQGGGSIQAAIWYPSDAQAQPVRAGLSLQTVAVDDPVAGKDLPLVVISHGNGGFWGGHTDTAVALAEAGFVVAALTHPGDNFADPSRATNLPARPRHLRSLLDYMLGAWSDRGRLDPDRIGAFGFSAGGFTVLAAAGAEGDPTAVTEHCGRHPEMFDCRLLMSAPLSRASWSDWRRDDRIRAIVAAAPGLGYAFTDASLGSILIPVQLWQAEQDEILAAPHHVEPVRDRLAQAETHLVPGARHFDFLAPCAPEVAAAEPMLCGSAPGFDRVAFHSEFNREVVRFFREALPRP